MRKAPPPAPRTVEKRVQPGRLRAIVLAVLVHAAFFSLIVFGVRWQSSPSVPLEAELWDKLPPVSKKAAPEPAKPEPAREEPPKPEPPKPEPPKPEPPKPEVKPEPPKPDPAIAQKLEREKREKEKRERLERQREEEVKKQREEKAKKEKEEQVRKQREREEIAKKKREDEERTRQEAQVRETAAKARQSEIGMWKDRIVKKIRDRANIPDTITGTPNPEFLIRILPGGEVLDITLTKPSGNRAYDAAIERAIRSASPLPVPDANSELFPQFRELNLNFKHER